MIYYLIFGVCILPASLWLLWVSTTAWARRRKLLRSSVQVTGKIVRLDDITSDGDAVITYMPYARYRGIDGQYYEAMLWPVHDATRFATGKSVKLFYERENPQNAVDQLRTWDVNLAVVFALFLTFIAIVVCAGNVDYWLLGGDPVVEIKP